MTTDIILANPKERAAERDADQHWGDFMISEIEEDDGERATVTVSEKVAGPTGFGGWTTSMPWPIQPRPKVGMLIRVWSNGSMNHGVSLVEAGDRIVPVYYKTKKERDAEFGAWLADNQKRQHEEFAKDEPRLDTEFEKLVPPLKARIQRFRDEDPNFRWKEEGYEMAAVAEANRLYKAALDPETGVILKRNGIKIAKDPKVRSYDQPKGEGVTDWEDTPENRLEAIGAVNDPPNNYNYQLLESMFPWIDKGHSGNTWGHAMMFARILVRDGDAAKL